jgi:DNA topoisomerase-3
MLRKPLPLTTVELQKAGSRLLKLAPKAVLDVRFFTCFKILCPLLTLSIQIAEKLYQQGYVSYPRTETDRFDPQFDFKSLIQKQAGDQTWGTFAAK